MDLSISYTYSFPSHTLILHLPIYSILKLQLSLFLIISILSPTPPHSTTIIEAQLILSYFTPGYLFIFQCHRIIPFRPISYRYISYLNKNNNNEDNNNSSSGSCNSSSNNNKLLQISSFISLYFVHFVLVRPCTRSGIKHPYDPDTNSFQISVLSSPSDIQGWI